MTAAGRVNRYTARTDLADRISGWQVQNPDLDTVDVLLAAARVVETVLRTAVGLPPLRPHRMVDGLDVVVDEWVAAHPVVAGPEEVIATLLDWMAVAARGWADDGGPGQVDQPGP